MNIKKGESHRHLILPVLLILAAAFVATSLSLNETNSTGITGAATAVTGQQITVADRNANRCKWVENGTTYPYTLFQQVDCPSSFPKVTSGGCRTSDSIGISEPFFNGNEEGWTCANGFNATVDSSIYRAYAYCCKYNQ